MPDPVPNISRPSKHVGGVSSLGHFNDNRLLEIEYVFVPENVHRTCALCEFHMIVGVVIRTPSDLRHIKVAGEPKVPAQALQLTTLGRNLLHVVAEMVDMFPVLAETCVRAPCVENVLLQALRNL